jgi:hypothetical protein
VGLENRHGIVFASPDKGIVEASFHLLIRTSGSDVEPAGALAFAWLEKGAAGIAGPDFGRGLSALFNAKEAPKR